MAFGPQDSRIQVTDDLDAALRNAKSPEEIREALHAAAIDAALVVPDAFDRTVLLPVDQPQPKKFAKVVILDGEKHILESDSEQGLVNAELELMRAKFHPQANAGQSQNQQQPRDAKNGQFLPRRDAADDAQRADEAEAVRLAELDLKFKRGEVSAAEYIKQSGAVDDYLAAKGIDAEALAEASQRRESEAAEREVAKFLETSDWPGGEANQETMGQILLENNLPATAESMCQVYKFMKGNNLVKPNEAVEREKELRERVQNAQSIEELKALYGSPAARQFGYR